MMTIRLIGIIIHPIGELIGEIVHLVVKRALVIDTGIIQSTFGISLIPLMNHIIPIK